MADPLDLDAARLARFWSRVDRSGTCWLWTGTIDRAGYAVFHIRGRTRMAYRVAYELVVGPIPAGLTIDHLCRVRHCVNPQHLEPVTMRENTLRSPTSPPAINARKTQCPRGHPYDDDNTYLDGKGRQLSCVWACSGTRTTSGWSPMTPEELDAIERRTEAATPEPWDYGDTGMWSDNPDLPDDAEHEYTWGSATVIDSCPECEMKNNVPLEANREFIAHARSDVPALVARVRQLEEALETVRQLHPSTETYTVVREALGR